MCLFPKEKEKVSIGFQLLQLSSPRIENETRNFAFLRIDKRRIYGLRCKSYTEIIGETFADEINQNLFSNSTSSLYRYSVIVLHQSVRQKFIVLNNEFQMTPNHDMRNKHSFQKRLLNLLNANQPDGSCSLNDR